MKDKILKKIFAELEMAWNANQEAHQKRNRFNEHRQFIRDHQTYSYKIERDNLYKSKLKYILRAIQTIKEHKVWDIQYGFRDWIVYFQYKDTMITFHIPENIEVDIKYTKLKWDKVTHQIFPFNKI